uniref:serine/threonine-protein phosphatase 2A regulatory subunit B'' subunit beta-like isoform X2 n=1 Tax=Myxine glutinosa TaxID=7769 RepID=UPI00358E216F
MSVSGEEPVVVHFGGALQPVLKIKAEELFLRWLGESETQRTLSDLLQRVKYGGPLNTKSRNTSDSPDDLAAHTSSSSSHQSSRQSGSQTGLPCTGCSLSPGDSSGRRRCRRFTSSKRVPSAAKKEKPALPAATTASIPRFYFPRGRPTSNGPSTDQAIDVIEKVFAEFPDERASIQNMGKVAKACGCPLYWKSAMFHAASGERTGFVSVHTFIAMWRKVLKTCNDDSSRFVALLARPGCNYLLQEDFIPLLQDIVESHPGLTFLKDAPEFHSRYITTVIQRIFYVVNRSWSGKITLTELRRNNFLQTLALLEEEEDINQVTDYFSYEHFYVIYCKFWELDTDHDLYIDEKDLARHNDHAISSRIIGRIFSGAVTRGNAVQREKKMSYADFVWFLISEEDKKSPTSIEYWFRCLDLDGDGVLSMFELESFYDEQCRRMEQLGIEPLPFSDCLCQMLDLVKPKQEGKITLLDLKRCKMAYIFFDTFFNLEKYLEHEQKDPFAMQKEVEGDVVVEQSDWDRYAAEEYEVLVAEESANQQLQALSYEEELEEALLGKPVSRLTLSEAPGPASQTCGQRLLAAGDGDGFDDFEY